MGFSKFLTSLTDNREKVNKQKKPMNAELQQGSYYLDKRRQMSVRMQPNLRLIEAFTSEPPVMGGGGAGEPPVMGGGGAGEPPVIAAGGGAGEPPKRPAVVVSADDESDDEGDLNALEAKFQTLLSKYGTTYKTYMEQYIKNV